jgi:hypothetical protein
MFNYIGSPLLFTNKHQIVGFEVLTAMIIMSSIVWNIAPYNPLQINRRFGGSKQQEKP